MTPSAPDLLAIALDYASKGWAVLPLHTPFGTEGGCSCSGNRVCTEPSTGTPRPKNAGKHPRTRNGVKDATTDADTIKAWWAQWPDANVGIAAGTASGVFVLDIDGPDGEQALKGLQFVHDDLPLTLWVSTGRPGGGRHLWFRQPDNVEIANRSKKLGAGLDVRSTGGYVVAPPSLHHSGRRYSFGSAVDEAIAEAPAWLVDLIRKDQGPKPQPSANRTPDRTPLPEEPQVSDLFNRGGGGAEPRSRFQGALETAEREIATAPEGRRNQTVNDQCYSVGGLWVHWGQDDEGLFEEAIARLEVLAQQAEQPPSMVRRAMMAGRAKPPPEPVDRPRPEGSGPSSGAQGSSSQGPSTRLALLARLALLVDNGDSDGILRDAEVRGLVAKPGDLGGEVEIQLLRLPTRLQQAIRRVARRDARATRPQAPDATEHRDRRQAILQSISRENKDGQLVVVTTLGTAVTVLQEDPTWAGKIRRNELSGVDHLADAPIDLDVEIEVAETMERLYHAEWPIPKVQNAIRRVGAAHPFHPVRDYLDGLPPWDGVPRIARLLPDYFGVPDFRDQEDRTELHAAYGRGLLIAMVARARFPGCKVDTVLVLYGEQGALKSTALAALVPDRRMFHDDAVPLHDEKRLGMILRGPWLVELAELASISRSDIESAKGAISRSHDRYVPMFGRSPVEVPRGCVLVATANPDSGRGAPEAGRRWWVAQIPAGSSTNPEQIAADRDQLFAEAVHAYEAGEAWHLPAHLDLQQRNDVSSYVESDEWVDALARFTDGWQGGELTGSDLCYRASGLELLRLNMAEQRRFGSAARSAGWSKVGGGKDGHRWRPPGMQAP